MLRSLALSLAVLALLGARPAAGATVSNATTARLDFFAGAGEANRVTFTSSGDRIVVTDPGATTMRVGGTCMPGADPQTVSCPAAGIGSLFVLADDQNDEVVNATSLGGELDGGPGDDRLTGGIGDERLDGADGADDLDGGGGADTLYGATLQAPDAGNFSDRLRGGPGNDQLFGSGGADDLDGGAGDDQLQAGSGSDMAVGGDGADSVVGGDGDDTEDGGSGDDAIGTEVTLGVTGQPQDRGNDVMRGGPGSDTLIPGAGPPFPDADAVSGGDGFDAVTYASRMTAVSVSKDAAADDGDAAERDDVGLDVEQIVGGAGSDTLRGGPGDDRVDGGPGDDNIDGLSGDDTLRGDAGPGAGTDVVAGGPGDDVVDGDAGGDVVSGDAGADTVDGGADGDTLSGGTGPDHLVGGAGEDVASYAAATDATVRLDAGTGRSIQPGDSDRLDQVEDVSGGARRDTLTGAADANVLDGAAEEDYVDGRGGRDRLDGGASADVVASRDGARDEPVACGPGRDLAIVDPRDPVVRTGPQRCEQVDNGTRRTPHAGQVYVGAPRCAASSGGAEFGPSTMHRLVPLRYAVMLASGFRGRRPPSIDAGDCNVRLTAMTGRARSASAEISGDAVWIDQTAARSPATMLTVKPPSCPKLASAPRHEPQVRVNVRRRGRWRVRGRYSIGASYGTDWTTVDGCSRTTTIVRRGRVRVYDRIKRRTITVGAGHRYVARAP
jgi:Ca2+-binding RTX toxin-like protein